MRTEALGSSRVAYQISGAIPTISIAADRVRVSATLSNVPARRVPLHSVEAGQDVSHRCLEWSLQTRSQRSITCGPDSVLTTRPRRSFSQSNARQYSSRPSHPPRLLGAAFSRGGPARECLPCLDCHRRSLRVPDFHRRGRRFCRCRDSLEPEDRRGDRQEEDRL